MEWDDHSRGKHDGSCVENGILYKYFECKHGAGSFVKPSKIAPSVTLVEAIRQRYIPIDDPTITTAADPGLPGAYITTSKGKQKKIEFVGEQQIRLFTLHNSLNLIKFRKWQQISAMNKVTIRNASISSCGAELNLIASHLLELDIQDNLFFEWTEVWTISI